MGTAGSPLSPGFHTFYVQERDDAGNWSASGSFTIEIDTTPPAPPALNPVTSPTNVTPQLLSGTKEAGTSVWLNNTEIIAINGDTTWSYDMPLSEGSNPITLKCENALGNESTATTAVIVLDTVPPAAPIVTGTTPTGDTTPTWSWSSGGEGNGTYRYQLDSEAGTWTETTATMGTAGSPLDPGFHTLYVQERDDAGNWSASGSFTIEIDTTL
jgi:hypothetical protein